MRDIYKKYWDLLQPLRPYRRNQLINILNYSYVEKRKIFRIITSTQNEHIDKMFDDEEMLNKFLIISAVLGGKALE